MKELLNRLIGSVTGIISKVMPNGDDAINLAHAISTTSNMRLRVGFLQNIGLKGLVVISPH